MLTVAARRTLPHQKACALRLFSSLIAPSTHQKENGKKTEGQQIHSTSYRKADVVTDNTNSTTPVVEKSSGSILQRFIITAEVTVSKIFPAGFGWQTSSIIAENYFGFAPETMNFALTTGFGDAVGVLSGHMAYYSGKKALSDSSINMRKELHTSILLGSAAFCSGTLWQPLVNALQGANLSFNEVFLGTWAGCGVAFYGGLRVGRTLLSGPLQYVQEPTYENSKNDASLSVAIGGATGFFVGTDAAYLPEQNFLIKMVGIHDGVPDLAGCAIAGTSTSLGFVSAQSALNMIYPAKKCWND